MEYSRNDTNICQEIAIIDRLVDNEDPQEDVYGKDRLNANIDMIDISDISHSTIYDLMHQKDATTKWAPVADIRTLLETTLEIKVHIDGGANRSITNDERLLHNIQPISNYKMRGADGNPTINCTKVGYFRLLSQGYGTINVKMYYSPEVTETIASPGDITSSSDNIFEIWNQHANMSNGTGYIEFSSKSGLQRAKIPTVKRNGLWYITQTLLECVHQQSYDPNKISIMRLTAAANHELWHQRLGHPGSTITSKIHLAADGVPNIQACRNQFYKCGPCIRAKMQKTAKSHTTSATQKTTGIGQRFYMDYGFIRGEAENGKKKIITSKDGYNCYLIIVDEFSRYTWIMLARDKTPPIQFVKDFLDKHGDKNYPTRAVRSDQGGELWKCNAFKEAVIESKFLLEPTGADDAAQNGVAENPNKTLGRMTRALLYNAKRSHEYWSYAIQHAVYIKNRLPHAHHKYKITPYEIYTGTKPNISNLRVWGCKVFVKKTGKRTTKLSDYTNAGIFLNYTATDKNIIYLDSYTGKEKIASHVVFDEANFSDDHDSPGSKALKAAGATKQMTQDQTATDISQSDFAILVKKISNTAKLPTRATDGSAGLDIYANTKAVIQPKDFIWIPTGISISTPSETYSRIAPKSGVTEKKRLDVKAGVVDNDFRGEIAVGLYNFGESTQTIEQGDKIAQLIVERYAKLEVKEAQQLTNTERGEHGFGSTDNVTTSEVHTLLEHHHNEIILSSDPYDDTITVTCGTSGSDPYAGLDLQDDTRENTVQLLHCKKSNPAAKIPKWRSTLRNATLVAVDDIRVQKKHEVKELIQQARDFDKSIQLTFATVEKTPIHPQKGIPQMYSDQLNIIAETQRFIRHGETVVAQHSDTAQTPMIQQLQEHKQPAKLTRKYLQQQDTWEQWREAEALQLRLYEKQKMFGKPVPRPKNSNILSLLWTYLIKTNGTKKARCVCNGNPKYKGTVTLAHTYAACLAQTGSRIFWATAALEDLIVIGANASNAFAEAPAPKAPLYVNIDKPFREWWQQQGRPPIPKGFVLPVQHALQGHPESPRLWAEFIDRIIREEVGLQPTTHEPCLYHGKIRGKRVLFLRQVDDFAVASSDTNICNEIIDTISKHLSAPMKNLGVIDSFNGVQIEQSSQYIKLHNTQYIETILDKHGWLNDNFKSHQKPLPMRADNKYLETLENAEGPSNEKERKLLEKKMGFKYRTALGEALYTMVTCRPDISLPIMKLSQYSMNPAEAHYIALKNVFRYLRSTKNKGITFWRKQPSRYKDLPSHELPSEPFTNILKHNPKNAYGYADSDWAGDTKHRKSVSGMCIIYGGAVIAYKSKFQKTIAQSSTEAEFAAACEAGKLILNIRTILDEINVPQENATILYEDNQGALNMANAGQPTRRTRHICIKQFALIEWVKMDLLELKYIETANNLADALTKQLDRTLFYRHFDKIMGVKQPPYSTHLRTQDNISQTCYNNQDHHSMGGVM